jgi:hypothetical protein
MSWNLRQAKQQFDSPDFVDTSDFRCLEVVHRRIFASSNLQARHHCLDLLEQGSLTSSSTPLLSNYS